MNWMIKQEQEDYPSLSSRSNEHQVLFNHCVTTFYNDDSAEEIIQARCSVHDVMKYLEENVDLCDTPLTHILKLIIQKTNFKGVDLELVKRKIMKQKNILKRLRAKARKNGQVFVRKIETEPLNFENEKEFQKKRNRMSAQISRDRKKEKVKELQELTAQLKQECEETRRENERLQREAELTRTNQSNFPFKGQIFKMFILLGVIFLLGVLKGIYKPSSQSQLEMVRIIKMEQESVKQEKTQKGTITILQANVAQKMAKAIEEPLKEVVEDKSLLAELKEKIGEGLQNWKQLDGWGLPTPLKECVKKVAFWSTE